MAALSPVVHPFPSVVNSGEPHLLESRRVGLEMVGDEMARSKALLLQKLAHQFLGSAFVSAGLDQAVKNLAFRCHCPCGRGRRERRSRAIAGPNRITHWRIVS